MYIIFENPPRQFGEQLTTMRRSKKLLQESFATTQSGTKDGGK